MAAPPRATRSALRMLPKEARRARSGRMQVVRGDGPAGVGYAVGKSVGGAVVRNRVRRQLRAAVAEGVGRERIGGTYLVIALPGIDRVPFQELVQDVRKCFEELDGNGGD